MHVKSARLLVSGLAAAISLSACSEGTLDSEALSPVSASLASQVTRSSSMFVSLPDTSLEVGDTIRLDVTAVNRRTKRNVTKEITLTYASEDTTVASVSETGLVTAKLPGNTRISVSASLGTAALVVIVNPARLVLDSTNLSNLPARPDSTPPAPSVPDTTPAPGSTPPPDAPGIAPTFATPFLPAASVDVTIPHVTGRTIRVAANDADALRNALNAAVGGDEIVLPNGSEYVGSFLLPKHAGSGVVVLRSETVSTAPGTRVTPATASGLAKFVTRDVFPAIKAENGSSGWRLIGLQVQLAAPAYDNYGIVVIGPGTETEMSQLVSNIVLDRMYITGGEISSSRCVAMNGNSLAVINSWLAECHAKGRDSEGILGWTGVGPFLIENNHIEGAGQNIMFGCCDPNIADLTPSDITIRRNHLFKPLSWGNGKWTVKAAFELKHARRVLFEANVIENHWIDGQVGYAIMFLPVSDQGKAPWTKVWDVTTRDNIIKNSTMGMNVLSRLTNAGVTPTEPMRRMLFQNNLFLNVGRDPISGATSSNNLVQLLGDQEDVTVMQNTFLPPSGVAANSSVMFAGDPNKRLLLSNNVFGASTYGVFGSSSSEGTPALAKYALGSTVSGNALAGRTESVYPAGNAFPATITASDFVAPGSGDYTLRSTLPWATSAGSRVGVNGARLLEVERAAVTR